MRAFIVAAIVAGIVLTAGHAFAQGVVAPQAGCKATPAELEANKKVAMAFFAPNADRVALADPSYKQHNPAFIPRNHLVEEALRAMADDHDASPMDRLLDVLASPYDHGRDLPVFSAPGQGDRSYRTFCGT